MQIALPLEHPVEHHAVSLAVLLLAGITISPTEFFSSKNTFENYSYKKSIEVNVAMDQITNTLTNINLKEIELLTLKQSNNDSNLRSLEMMKDEVEFVQVQVENRQIIRKAQATLEEKNKVISRGNSLGLTQTGFIKLSLEESRKSIINIASSWKGTPYLWGGNSRAGIDCSALVQNVYREIGITLPRTSYEQFRQGIGIARSNLLAGDLVFFSTNGPGASHVGIYLGDSFFISATRLKVEIQSLDLPYWNNSYRGSKRILN